MIFKQDANNNIYTTLTVPAIWYAYDVGSDAVALVEPSCKYDSITKHGICSTGDLVATSMGIYFQVGNGDPANEMNLVTLLHEQSVDNLMVYNYSNTDPKINPPAAAQYWANTGPVNKSEFVVNSYGYLKSYPKTSSIKFNVPPQVLTMAQDGDVYAAAYLLLQFKERHDSDSEGGVPAQGIAYMVSIQDFGKISVNPIQSPTTPKNLTIISVRDPSKKSKTDPDIVLQWDASKAGSAPLTGYEVQWGTDAKNLNNNASLLIGKSPDLQYNPGNNTYTYSMPNGTLQILQNPSDLYYFAVVAFDNGSDQQTFSSTTLSKKWYNESWFPPQYLLATCPPLHTIIQFASSPNQQLPEIINPPELIP